MSDFDDAVNWRGESQRGKHLPEHNERRRADAERLPHATGTCPTPNCAGLVVPWDGDGRGHVTAQHCLGCHATWQVAA